MQGFTDTKSLRVQKPVIFGTLSLVSFTDTKSLRVQKQIVGYIKTWQVLLIPNH